MPFTSEETEILKHVLIDDEGLKKFPYMDCCSKSWRDCSCKKKGYLTIGVGRNLETVGLSEEECIYLEMNDITKMERTIDQNISSWFKKLNSPRKIVIGSMIFNMGFNGFKKFEKMIKCIESGDFMSAGNEMLKSLWSLQVGERAQRLANLMKNGQF